MHRLVPLALALLTLTVGCIGSFAPDEAVDETGVPGTLEGPITRQATLDVPGSGEAVHSYDPGDATIGGVFIEYVASIDGDTGELTFSVHFPDGDSTTVATLTATPLSSTTEGWAVLHGFDARDGGIELKASSDAAGTLDVNVTLAPEVPEPSAVPGTAEDGRTVVAVIDTGINPYHDVFQRPELTTDVLPARIQGAESGQAPLRAPIDQAESYRGSIAHDASLWSQLPSQRLIHFEGTNILGYELRDQELPQLPVLDRAGHGTMVAHAITRENPDVLVTLVTAQDYDDGVRWAAKQPWIDLISLSWGPAVNTAGAAEPYATGFDTYEATRAAHQAGKVTFTATGNDPTLAFTDTTSGPPWAHAVSGAEPEAGGRAILSGNLVDTVANWTQTLAGYESLNATSTASGTSFATPTTAGIASRILHDLRTATGHTGGIQDGALVAANGTTLTNSDLRSALNRTAVYWDTADYSDPTIGPSAPVAPVPAASMGWGYLDGSRVTPAVDHLLGHEELPTKSAEADAIMQANLDLRQTWWNDLDRPQP